MSKKRATTKKVDAKAVAPSTPAVATEADVVSDAQATVTTVEQGEKQVTQEQIAAKAKEIWTARGTPWGQDLEIWLEAERVLRGG